MTNLDTIKSRFKGISVESFDKLVNDFMPRAKSNGHKAARDVLYNNISVQDAADKYGVSTQAVYSNIARLNTMLLSVIGAVTKLIT